MAANKTTRFGIIYNGKRSSVWTCTLVSSKEYSVFITMEYLAKAVKLTYHQSGQVHAAFLKEQKDNLFDADNIPSSRLLGKTERKPLFSESLVVIARIYIPLNSTTPSNLEVDKVIWINADGVTEQCIEVTIIATNQYCEGAWPGMKHGRTKFVQGMQLDDNKGIYIVWCASPATIELPESLSHTPFKGKSLNDIAMADLSIGWNINEQNEFTFFETSISLSPA
jgi:hypothetical protein